MQEQAGLTHCLSRRATVMKARHCIRVVPVRSDADKKTQSIGSEIASLSK